ncbi:MAG: ABC transporter ATP-binding protein [Deltaproteobacteria bacterium]|nr:ABC transporter ATP-binding protein [Deltaproteobacteria bacterium]
MPILEGSGLTIRFGGLTAVSNVDFSVEQGEIFGLIGPNGAGKTTLFNLISAALKPQSGIIRFKGREITGLKPYRICRMGLARTFQVVKLFGNMNLLDNVVLAGAFGRERRISRVKAEKDAAELLEFVELPVGEEMLAKELTLGRQKRLEVARALATQPDLLLLDEMMEGLNPTEVAKAMALVRKIQARGVTVIMIEHVMKAIMNVCERIMVLHHGAKIAEGTPSQVSADKTVIEVYFGAKANAGS